MKQNREQFTEADEEILSEDERKVAGLLGDLKRVETPKDFDFRLRARIAQGRPETSTFAALFPILKYAVPLGLFLVVGAAVFLSGSFTNWQAPLVAEVNSERQLSPETVPDPGMQAQTSNTSDPNIETLPAVGPPLTPNSGEQDRTPVAARNTRISPGIRRQPERKPAIVTPVGTPGVIDRAITGAGETIGPRGFDITGGSPQSDPGNLVEHADLKVSHVLQSLGIDAGFEGNSWLVKNVSGIAEKAGVKAGDTIYSIDGDAIDDKTVYKGQFRAKSIQVRRNREILSLEIAPAP